MDNYFNLERVKQAHGLCGKIREAGLGFSELGLLMVLGRKMGNKTDIRTGEVKDGCRATLDTLERETTLERKAIGAALGRLVQAGFIQKTYDRRPAYELTKEGRRRLARGLSLVCAEKNNYQRRSVGAPRKDGSTNDNWQHCVYHLVPEVWDSVVFESRKVSTAQVAPVSEEDQVVMDSIDFPSAAEAAAEATNQHADQVFAAVNHYFQGHSTLTSQSEQDARRSLNAACVELAQRALGEGNIEYANNFLWWMKQRRPDSYLKLMDGSIKHLGVSFGLQKYIVDLWDEFAPERDDDIPDPNAPEDDTDNDESESVGPTNTYDEDGDCITASMSKPVAPNYDFDFDEGAELVQEVEPTPPAREYDYQREAFATALAKETSLLKRPTDWITIRLDSRDNMFLGGVGKCLDSVPYDEITYERVSQTILRVSLTWRAARYIAENAEQFAEDGLIDPDYQPYVDPSVLAAIEAEKRAAELREREEAAAAEIQRKADEAAEEVACELDIHQRHCRSVLLDVIDADEATFCYIGEAASVRILRDYLIASFPRTVKITNESDSMLEGTLAPSLLEAMIGDPVGFRLNGHVETVADQRIGVAA